LFVKIDENVRGRDVYIIQPTNPPAENLIELLLLMDAARRASAARITAVIPYFGYARQDRKDQPRVAISAKLVANLVSWRGQTGCWRWISTRTRCRVLRHSGGPPVRVAGADGALPAEAPEGSGGGCARRRLGQDGAGFAKRLNGSLAIIDKRRPSANIAEVLNVVGEVEGKDCLIPDDLIDTAGTVTEAAAALKRLGAGACTAARRHALLSGPAIDRLMASPIEELAVTNTICCRTPSGTIAWWCYRWGVSWRRRSRTRTATGRYRACLTRGFGGRFGDSVPHTPHPNSHTR